MSSRRPILLLMILTLFAAALIPDGAIRSQEPTDAEFPPAVIDVFPSGTVELLPNDPLTVTFDQPMDRASVEAAFSLSPDLPGLLLWSDAQTLTFTPTNGFPVQKNYTLRIDKTARAINGIPLEADYTTELRTLGTFGITNVVPARGATDATRDTQIVIGFSRPMIALGTPEQRAAGPMPFTSAPAINGRGEWINTSLYVFTPSGNLPSETEFTITLLPTLNAADGAALASDQETSWTFRTMPPGILSVTPSADVVYNNKAQKEIPDPENIYPNSDFTIVLTDPVTDRAKFQSQVVLNDVSGAPVPGNLAWKNSTTLVFTPGALLARGQAYTLIIAADGDREKVAAPFRVLPNLKVESSNPGNGSRATVGLLRDNQFAFVGFNVPLAPESLKGRVLVSVDDGEPINAVFEVNEYTSRAVYIRSTNIPIKAGSRYTLTFKAGIADRFGGVLASDHSISFTAFEPPPPEPKPATPAINGDLMLFPTYRGAPRIPFLVARDEPETIPLALYRMSPTEAGSFRFTNHQYFLYGPTGRSLAYTGGLDDAYIAATNLDPQCVPPPAVKPENLLREWDQILTRPTSTDEPDTFVRGESIAREVPLTDAQGTPITPGLYWMTTGNEIECAQNPGAENEKSIIGKGPAAQFGVAVANANIVFKRGPNSIFVWVTDMQTAQPIPNQTVTIYADGKAIGSGKTGADGALVLPVRMAEHRFILITAEGTRDSSADGGKVYGVWYHNWESSGWRTFGDESELYYGYDLNDPQEREGYLYTDRPIYRPGDTVKYRGVLRSKRDLQYLVESREAWVRIGQGYASPPDYGYVDNEMKYLDQKITLNEYGAFSGEFTIPADAKLGEVAIIATLTDPAIQDNSYAGGYRVNLQNANTGFIVAEYRAPEYQVTAATEQASILRGDPLTGNFNVNYYFGGAVGNANIAWSLRAERGYFNYTGEGRYSFIDWRTLYTNRYYEYGYYDTIAEGRATTNADGQAIVTTSQTNPERISGTLELTLSGTATDESGFPVGTSVTAVAHPADLYTGIGVDRYAVAPNTPVSFNLIAVRPDSTPIANQQLTVTIETCKWSNGSYESVPVGNPLSATTDTNGKAVVTTQLAATGYYCVTVSGADSAGRTNSALITLWIFESRYASWYQLEESDGLSILSDRPQYRAGDTATLLIPNPFKEKTTVLVTAERAGLITHTIVTGENGAVITAELPITDAAAPNVFINAVYLQGRDGDQGRPAFRISRSLEILVESTRPRLNIDLRTAQTEIKPGQTVQFQLQVTNSDGQPVPKAEIGVKLVDKAVLDLLPDNSGNIYDAFFSRQQHETETDVAIDGLLDPGGKVVDFGPPGRGGGGGGGGGPGIPIRSEFETTPLWSPSVITDDQGRATVSVKMPDNLTTFRLDARAVTLESDFRVGTATLDIISTLPLIIRPVAPRFMVAGDRLELAAVINNNTANEQQVTARIEAVGVTLDSAAAQIVTIPAGGRVRVTWPAIVGDGEGVDLTFYAVSQNGAQDAAKPALRTGPNETIPIRKFIVNDAPISTGGVLREAGSISERISIPPRLNTGEGQITVRVDPSLAAALPDSFRYLQQLPYYCIEQTISTFLPNLVTVSALKQIDTALSRDGRVDPALTQGLDTAVTAALEKLLKEQKAEGGWGWYASMNIDSLTSIYATYGLILARKAGYPVDEAMLRRAIGYLRTQGRVAVTTTDWQLSRQAFLVYVLSQDEQFNTDTDQRQYEALLDVRSRLTVAGRAFLLMAFDNRFPDHQAVATLRDDLIGSAVFGANGTYWQESTQDWWNWGTDTRSTALVLTALVQVAPESDLLPNVARWLMAVREIERWQSTQETVWAITGLTGFMLATNELNGSYDYTVRLNRDSLLTGSIAPDTIREYKVVEIDLNELAAISNRLIFTREEGTGVLYYTARVTSEIPAAQAQPYSNGVRVQRDYFTNDGLNAVTSAKVGDKITVRLSITIDNDLTYFVLEDHIPAGAEPLDPQLLTTAPDGQNVRFSRNDPRWYYNYASFRQVEIRDSGIHLYADYLPRGSYTFTYQIQAVIPGVYQVIPATGYSFYITDVYGRSEGKPFEIVR